MVQMGAWRSAIEWFRRLSWRSLRFPALFLVSVAVLTLVYRLRSDRIDKEEAEKAETSRILLTSQVTIAKIENASTRGPLWPDEADLSELASHERWVVVSGVEEEVGRPRSQSAEAVACSLATAVKAHGWRPIVIGEGINCCRLPDCVPLDNALLSRLPYRVIRYARPSQPRNSTQEVPVRLSALRNAAFLFAIQHGARFVFDAYPPDGDSDLSSWAKEIFSSVVLGTSVGLVLDGHSYSLPTSVPGAPTPRVLNPYAHFGRSDLWAKGYDVHGTDEQHHQQHLRYRVCEIRQPAMEMFLDVWDGGSADLIAPPVTVPSSILAPYGSRNVLYTRDAFWGLALFPGGGNNSSTSPRLSSNLARALWNHALLGATLDAGGVRFSLLPGTEGVNSNRSSSMLSRLYSEEDHSINADMRAYIATFTSRVLRWRCRSTTLLPCLSQLASDFLATSLLTPEDSGFMDSWVADLRRVRYLPPPTLPWSPRPPPRPPGPCIHPQHHHHRQVHDPPLPHPTTLTFHPIPLQKPAITMPSPVKMAIARFHRDAALLDWSVGDERTKEEVALVEETLIEDKLLSDEASKDDKREENQSRKAADSIDRDKKDEDEEEVTENPLGTELASTRTFLGDTADHLCPGFAPLASPLLPHRPSNLKMEDILLVVWFPRPPRYDLLPALELLRTRHFPNALFCGPPHRALPSMLSRFDVHTSPSFLTASSRSDCLLTALEMGYRVGEDGSLLLVEESALPIPWNLAERNRSLIWFRTEEGEVGSKRSPRETEKKSWDGGDFGGKKSYFRGPEESVIAAAEGLASALRFLARLMGVRPNPHLHPHHHPMEEIEHEDAPWGRVPGNNTNSTNLNANSTIPINVTVEVDYANETSVIVEEKVEVESTTVFEREISLGERSNYTDEVPAVVEEIKATEFEEVIKPAVEHEETPTLEYEEPVLVEYTEPPPVEKQEVEEGEITQTERNVENKEEEIPSEEADKVKEGDSIEHITSEPIVIDDHVVTTEKSQIEERQKEVIPETEEKTERKYSKDGESHEGDALIQQQQRETPVTETADDVENGGNHEDVKENAEGTAKEPLPSPPTPEEEVTENTTDEKRESTVKDNIEESVQDGTGSSELKHEESTEGELTDTPEKIHFDSEGVQHEDTPAIEYSEPPEMERFEAVNLDPFKVNETLGVHTIHEGSVNLPDVPEVELNLDGNKTVATLSDISIVKSEPEASTEWPPLPNVTSIPWNDNDTKFDLPANSSSSDWATSADAEEILSSITMIENTHENDTEIREKKEESSTEYYVNPTVNLTTVTEEPANISTDNSFEIKSPELYDDEKTEEEPVGDGEQSLLEQDTLLSYKDDEEIPQFVGLPSSTVKAHGKSLEASLSEVASFEERRRRKRESYSYSMDGFKEQFSRAREAFEDGVDDGSAVRTRLNRSLQEVAELFAELASSFPEDANAVLQEEGVPEVVSYPSPHYGLDHMDFRHLHCVFSEMDDGEEEDWGDSDSLHFEPCTVLRRFFLRLYYSHQSEGSMLRLLSLATTRGSAPIFHLPMRLQRELHLTASLLLSQGFPEEAVLPLLVYGLAGEKGWVNLRKSSFEHTDGAFPMFDDTADFIHPSNLRVIPEEPRLKSVFCLKFLLRVLDG